MSRKKILIETVEQYLIRDNQSTLTNRQYRYYVLLKIIDDFYLTKTVPVSWYALTTLHVHSLLQVWRNKNLKDSTMMNYLVCLRYFLKKISHEVPGIDNQSLGLSKKRNDIKPAVNSETILTAIKEPIAFLLLGLQIRFGLTLQEAMHLVPCQRQLKSDPLLV